MNAWNKLYEKYQIATAIEGIRTNVMLGGVQSFLKFLREIREDWSRWSVVFGCLGAGVVCLSAVLSGCAALKDAYGVKCQKAPSEGAFDPSSSLTTEIEAAGHKICTKKRKSGQS